MILLAIDLTSAFGSLAVRVNGRTAASHTLQSTDGFGHLIFAAIERVLADAAVKLESVDCFAGASGPGAFTGVRVGLAAVKGLAFGLGKPAAGVSNLRALSTFGTTHRKRAVVLDARRGDVFAGVYDAATRLVVPETVGKLSLWLEGLQGDDYEFIAAAGVAGAELYLQAPRDLAEAVAVCAEMDGKDGRWSGPAALDANYVRRSDAEMFWAEG